MIHKAFSERNGHSLTVVISDHGFQSHYKRFNLGNWLETKGYLKIRKNAISNKVPVIKKITRGLRIGKILRHLFSINTIEKIDKKYISKSELYDWDTSIACSVGRSNEGFIYLLTGNEHDKVLLGEKLREELLQIRDMETGNPIVRQVRLKQDLYHGSLLERIPDIIIDPVDGYSFTGYYQPNQRLIHTVNTKDDMHMGKHHREGIFIGAGTSIVSGEKIRANILDLTPTLLAFMGIPVPEEMDGIVLSQWLKLPRLGAISTSAEKGPGDGGPQDLRFSKKESDEIENRLKDLGYL
jgi:predicted AlkP superfamily phosphohydrolase/phosphomutase